MNTPHQARWSKIHTTHSLNIKEPQAKELIHVCKDYWPGALITLGPKKWGPLRLVPRFLRCQGSQPTSREDSSRARASSCAPRTHRTNRWIFALERSRPDRPTDRSFGVRADHHQTDARTHLDKTPSASVGRGEFIPRFSCPLPLLVATAQPRAPSDPRFSERGARARLRSDRWR